MHRYQGGSKMESERALYEHTTSRTSGGKICIEILCVSIATAHQPGGQIGTFV